MVLMINSKSLQLESSPFVCGNSCYLCFQSNSSIQVNPRCYKCEVTSYYLSSQTIHNIFHTFLNNLLMIFKSESSLELLLALSYRNNRKRLTHITSHLLTISTMNIQKILSPFNKRLLRFTNLEYGCYTSHLIITVP